MSVLDRVGPYDVLDRRPEGTGVLCLAKNPADGRQVLLRLVSIDAVTGRERLVGELEALAVVQHRNLVQVVDVVDDVSGVGLVTEVLEGATLDETASKHPLGVRAVLQVGAQVCAGLHFGHALGLTHGRLRADQVCITPDGTAKVLNLGLSLIERVATSPDRPDADLDRATEDWRLADLRGVGAILYQGLTGREPSSPRSVRTTLLDRDRVPALGEAPAAVADDLLSLIELLLDPKRDPRSRCADAAALGRALTAARLALDEPSVEAAPSPTEQAATILMERTIERPAPGPEVTVAATAIRSRTWPAGPKMEEPSPRPERGAAAPSVAPVAQPPAPKAQPAPPRPAPVAEAPPGKTRGTPVQPTRDTPVRRPERPRDTPPLGAPSLGPVELGTMMAPLPTAPPPEAPPDRRTRDLAVWASIGAMAIAAAGLAFWLLPGASPRESPRPPATTTPPAGTWTLSLDSDPQGAAIAVDGTPRPEVTPLDLALPRSPYPTIELTLEGFRPARVPVSDTVRLNGRVRVRLEPIPPPAGGRKVPVVVNGSFPFEIVQGGRVISPAASEHAIDVRAGDLLTVRSAQFYLERSFLVPAEGLQITLPAVARVAFEATDAHECAIAIGSTITDRATGGEPLLVPLGAYQFSLRCRDGRPRIRTARVIDVPLNRVTFPPPP